MPCHPEDEVPPPSKKLRSESPSGKLSFTLEEVTRICSASNEKCELEVLTRELDSLDEDAVFARMHRRVSTEKTRSCESTLPPISGLYPFPKRGKASDHCVYLPPKRLLPDNLPRVSEGFHVISLPANDADRPEIAQGARLEASVLQRIAQLKTQGLWSAGRLPKVMEPKQGCSHHNYMMNELLWLSADFAEERKWKKQVAYQLAKSAQTYLLLRQEWNRRCQIAEEQIRLRNAASVAKIVKKWWIDVKQDLNDLGKFVELHGWDHVTEENKLTLARYADLAPTWFSQVDDIQNTNFVTSCEPSDNHQHLSEIPVPFSDGESNDDEWLPCVKDSLPDELDSISSRSSRSTSSSRVASFVDDDNANAWGITELPSMCESDDWTQVVHSHLSQQPNKNCFDQPTGERSSLSHSCYRSLDMTTSSLNIPVVSCELSDTARALSDSVTSAGDENAPDDVIQPNEVESLLSDSIAPLHIVLQPYRENGWTITHPKHCGTGETHWYLGSTCSTEFARSSTLPSKSTQAEVSALLSDADLPLEEVVSPGYLEQFSSRVRSISSNQSSPILGELKNSDMQFGIGSTSDTSHSSDIKTARSGFTIASCLRSECQPGLEVTQCQVTAPPWGNRHCSEPLCHPLQLREAAVSLSPLLRSFSLWSDKSVSALATTGWNPAFRVWTLPSHNLGCAVTWLRQAFFRTVPGLILSPSHISGDAELTVAAHLGQLTIGDQEAHSFCKSVPISGLNSTGDWGPHLIVTSHLSLPTWRTRLRTWCPGLKVTCLCLGAGGESSGKGRRLRNSVSRGVVNICLTTYSALRARPNRYSRIQWSVIVFDQVHNLLQHVGNTSNCTVNKAQRSQSALKTEEETTIRPEGTHYASSIENAHAERLPSISRVGRGTTIPLDLFTSELKCTGHRLLISSIPDLCSSLCGYRLYLLSRLLLLKDPVDSPAYNSWVSELFKASTIPQRKRASQSNGSDRPTKRQLIKFMEPFIIRLDEDDEWEMLVDEEIIPCPMTSTQAELHDAILASKTARNASKSGDLLDLLRTVSLASRVCSHPCLAAVQPRCSQRFQNVIQDLSTVDRPHGPFVFRIPSQTNAHGEAALMYNTPEAVVRAVCYLRESEWFDFESTSLNLSGAVLQSRYIRDRVASLAPTMNQFESIFNPTNLQSTASGTQQRPQTPIFLDGHNGIGRRDTTIQPIGDEKSDEFFSNIRSKLNSHLSNGLPEQIDTADVRDAVKQLDFANILVKNKRPRNMSGLPPPEHATQSTKRRRIDDSDSIIVGAPTKQLNGSIRKSSSGNTFPFLDPELLVKLEKHVIDGNSAVHKYTSPNVPNPVAPKTNSKTLGRNTDAPTVNGQGSLSPSVMHLMKRNNWKCTQYAGVADWCSLATCTLLQFDQRFMGVAQAHPIPSAEHPLTLTESLQLQLVHELSIWNIPRLYISHVPVHRLLCSCSVVIAKPPQPTALSLQAQISPRVTHTCRADHHPTSLRARRCRFLSYSPFQSRSMSCLSCAIDLLYQFTEHSRWLSSNSVFTRSCFNRWTGGNLLKLTPCGRLFRDSGKLQRLNQILGNILGARFAGDLSGRRPRCVFLLAHQNALLDLLESFLSASGWRSYPRIRLPSDEDSLGSRSVHLIERINCWPRGSCESLIVLVHSRCPAGSLGGLRAGPDTSVIVCDVDWRADTTDMLRFLFHSWALNGLVDLPKSTSCMGIPRPVLHIYRLVSTGTANSVSALPSMETCLSRGVACRLLPGAVFHAHSSATEDASLWSARVQPNVVSELLSCGPLHRPGELQSSVPKSFMKENEHERDLSYPIKPEAPSYSSSSSVASSFSFYASGPGKGVPSRNEDDEAPGFREREPLSEELLHRAFELFEDPTDVQAWCFGLAESNLSVSEFTDECSVLRGIDCDLQCVSSEGFGKVKLSSLDTLVHGTTEVPEIQDPCDLKLQLDYSDFDSWEVAHLELRDYLSSLEDRFTSDSCTLLAYDNVSTEHFSVFDNDEPENILGFPSSTPDQLNIWEPFFSTDATEPSIPSLTESNLSMTEVNSAAPNRSTGSTNTKIPIDFDDTDWGYESEPMSEQELPPITLPVVTSVSSSLGSVSIGSVLKRSESNLTSVTNAHSQTGKSADVTPPSATPTRTTPSGPSLKRRKLTAGSVSRRSHVPEQVSQSPSTPDDHTLQLHNQGEDSDVSMVPSPCSISSTSRGGIGGREGSTITCNSGLPTVGNSYNVSGTVLTTAHSQSGGANGVTSRLHIPRASYNREVGSARNNRLRRSNAVSATGSNAAAVAAMAASASLSKVSSYQLQSSQGSTVGSFPNSATLARYGLTSPGRSIHAGLPVPAPLPTRYNVGSQTGSGVQGAQGPAGLNQLHVGKPLEWLPYEESALYMCITKILDLAFDANSNAANTCPNFRLAEFFMNNYIPARGHRGARQCLVMHSRMLTVVATATAALSNNAFNFPQTVSALGLFNTEDGVLSASPPTSNTTISHGPTGRKVKNKLKSAAAAAAAAGITGSASQQGSLVAGAPASSGSSNVPDSAHAVSRYRAYLAYQYLQSCCSSHSTGVTVESNNNSTIDSSGSAPVQLSQMLTNLKASDDCHARIVRKAVSDSLSPVHPVPSSQPYRSTTSRRPLTGSLGSSSHMVSLSSVYPVGSGAYSPGVGSSSSIYGHHHGSTGSFPPVPLSHIGHAPTAPALLTHHRHRHQAVHDQSSSSVSESCVSVGGSGSSLSHTGPIIQKNPTHIAALQEHNINPDTLITPAMVIKNKEEREARLRAEAISTAQLNSVSSATITTTITIATTVSTSVYHQSQSNIHAPDTAHPQSGQLSLQLDSGGSGIMASLPLPMNLSGSHLSFTHANNQRGTSVMLPVRCGFGTHSLASANTVISLAHVGGSQAQQQRILGSTSASSTLNPQLSHSAKPQQQVLNPSMSRLAHFGSSNTLDLISAGPNTHSVSSSGVITSTSTETDGLGSGGAVASPGGVVSSEGVSSNIVLPTSWRTSSVSRNFGFQNSRISSLSCNQVPSSTAAQATKNSVPTSYFLQRSQFLSTSQASLSSRNVLSSHSGASGNSAMVVGGSYASSITSLPHILRPRSALRGSVIQPAFVRTITATSTSAVSVVPHQSGPRLSSSSNFAHSRVNLAVSSNSTSVSHILNSRTAISPAIRNQPSAIFQQLRPGSQIATGSGNAPVTFSFNSQTGSVPSGGEGRHYISQHQSIPAHQAGVGVPNTHGSVSTADSGGTGNKLDSEMYVTRMQHPPP